MKLKTLKDFLEPLYLELEKINQKIVSLKEKPSEEHTILMMTHSSITGQIRAYENSREEAIKWCKEIKKSIEEADLMERSVGQIIIEDKSLYFHCLEENKHLNFIKHFFNLTKENLK